MSKHQFKVGDKVKYNESNKQYAESNGHIADEVYTVSEIRDSLIYFDKPGENGGGCLWYRLERAKEETVPETFDYHQALKILAENPEAEIEFSANGKFWGKVAIPGEIRIPTGKEFYFRIKPQPKKYQWLYKTKDGKYGVTYSQYSSKEEAEANCSACGEIFIKPLNEETL